MFYSVSVLFLGFFLDMALGDPYWLPHPVRWIGKAIVGLEKPFRAVFPKSAEGASVAGALLSILVVGASAGLSWLLLWAVSRVDNLLSFFVEAWMCYQLLAAKSLKKESMKVADALLENDLPKARHAVSQIVGRDTARLSPVGVAKAAVETVAENTSDGVIAPLFFMAIGGAPLGFFYKAVNTLDSMIGYKNDRYLHFGKFAAKLDDLLNLIPSRVAAILMILSAALCGNDAKGAARIWKRDRRKHPSPNSAQTESACAGALGVQLAGGSTYGGVLCEKPTIGDDLRPVAASDISLANRLMYVSSFLALLLFSVLRILVLVFIQR